MASTIQQLTKKGLINPPEFLPTNVHYETIMGSVAYGVSSDTSDCDIYGFCIPKKEMLFPHLAGEILGFGRQKKRFEQYQQHHVWVQDELKGEGRSYDFQIFSIVKYFNLAMENNPNIIDSLFTPQNCVQHITKIGNMVRERRKIFLHKGAWHRFKGYAYSQLHKMKTKDPKGKRAEIRDKFGFDVKFAYHVVRLLNECEQILVEGDIDLQKNNEHLKAIRRGDVPEKEIVAWFNDKERQLENLYVESSLPHSPDEGKIKKLLMECLEEHYGNLSECVVDPDESTVALKEMYEVMSRYRHLLV